MFYHYNNITGEEIPTLTDSFKDDNDNNSFHNSITQSTKRNFEATFSEKFQWVKDCDKTVCGIVFPKKSTIRLIVLVLFFIGFLYFGAWCFQMLEHGNEIKNRDNFSQIRNQFIKEHKCVTDESLEVFIRQIERLKDMGLSAQNNASGDNWDIPTGVFFATTLVTTIGYGNDKPLTAWGKIFCIVFVIIGLPTMMILATAVIERLCVFTDLTFSSLCYRYRWKIKEDKFREIQIIVCISILLIGFICIPAWAFVAMEEGRWDYLEAVYYCVISLTTIGLGDYVPGESPNKDRKQMSKIFSTVYLFVGLLWASFCIQIFHQYHRWNVGSKFFYLRSDYSNFEYDNLMNTSSVRDSTEVNDITTTLEPLNPNFRRSDQRSIFKSYS